MTEAEHALREVTANIPADVRERLDTAEKLSDSDRETIVQIARKSLASFQLKPETKPDLQTKMTPKPQAEPQPEAKARPEVHTKGKTEPKVEPEGKS
jgi:F-type H+-transporting ATPase subunit alpha